MKRLICLLFALGFAALLCVGCGVKGPTAPDDPIGPPIGGTPPPPGGNPPPPDDSSIPKPDSFISSDGLVSVKLDWASPERGGRVVNGKEALVRFNAESRSDQELFVCSSTVNSVDENPGRPGSRMTITGFAGSCSILRPNSNGGMMFGYSSIEGAQDVTYLRLSGYYGGSFMRDPSAPAWTGDIWLGWKKG